jgi:hypothetical protein
LADRIERRLTVLEQSSSGPNVPPQPQPDPTEGRDARGRFTKNNKGGPGNPFARRVASLRQVLLDTVTDEDIREIAAALIVQAREGNLAATKLLFSYVLGKPSESVNPDTLDAQEWQLYQQAPVTEAGLQTVLGGLPTPLACEIARTALPAIHDQLASQIGHALQPTPPPAEAAPAVSPTAAPAQAESQASAARGQEAGSKASAKRDKRREEKWARLEKGAEPECPWCYDGLLNDTCDSCGNGLGSPAEAPPPAKGPLAALAALLGLAAARPAPSPNGS